MPDQMKEWWETQQQIISQWQEMTRPFWSASLNWQQTMQQHLRQMTQTADPTARETAEKLFGSQMVMLHLVELALKTWDNLLPLLQKGEDWESALQAQLARLRLELIHSATAGLHLGENGQNLWQAFLQEGQPFNFPWLKQSAQNPNGNQHLSISSHYWETFGRILQVGYTPQMEDQLQKLFRAWADLQQASFDYHVKLTDAWILSLEKLLRELAQLSQDGESIESLRDFLNRWSATADEVFRAVFQAEDYIVLQGKLVNAVMRYRAGLRETNDLILSFYDLPTRAEMDEAHRRIYELRKELKQLRRELAALRPKGKS